MDSKDLAVKKKFETDALQNLIARSYDFAVIQNDAQKRTIMNETEIFYRDHIKGQIGSDASHHNIKSRFPALNETMRRNISIFANEMAECRTIEAVEQVCKRYGTVRNVINEKFKDFMKSQKNL